MAYTAKDARRAAKEVTAIMTQVHGDIRTLSERVGVYLGIMDSIAGAPMTGSAYMLEVERALVALGESYGWVSRAIRNVPEDNPASHS